MSKFHRAAAGLVLLTATGTVAAASAVAAADASVEHDDGSRGHRQIIELVAEQADDSLLDLGDTGFGLGDQLLIADVLTRHGHEVGRSAGTCQIVRLAGEEFTVNCVTTLALPEGQLTVQGSLTVGGADPFIAAVTGGTGAFRSAHGEMVITPVDADTEQYRLTVSR
jgi:hypothetical protein